jgi:peptide deformylase
MYAIVQEGDPVLRKRAEEIPPKEIRSEKIQSIIAGMNATLAKERLGAALAAPQVGISLRIFVVSPDVMEKRGEKKENKPLVCINPEIVSQSKTKEELHEGCLSLRGWWGYTLRSEKVTLRAYDENGKEFERGASGLLAQIFQHEVDHLNGKLYIESAKDFYEYKKV